MTWCGGKKSKSKFTDFQCDCLDAHNSYRTKHGVPSMELSPVLCKFAEEHAKYLCACDSEKGSKGPYGENIFIKECTSRRIYANPYEAVRYWYDEGESTEPGSEVDLKYAKHYANIIWKETIELGVGFAMNSDQNKIFIVAEYSHKPNEFSISENLPAARTGFIDECPSTVKII